VAPTKPIQVQLFPLASFEMFLPHTERQHKLSYTNSPLEACPRPLVQFPPVRQWLRKLAHR